MKIKNSDTQYAGLVITMHWLMLVVLALVYACMELRELVRRGVYGNDRQVCTKFVVYGIDRATPSVPIVVELFHPK